MSERTASWEQKGEQRGEQKGAQQALEKVAVNLLREGMAHEAIARVTGLTVEQVQQLQAHQDSD